MSKGCDKKNLNIITWTKCFPCLVELYNEDVMVLNLDWIFAQWWWLRFFFFFFCSDKSIPNLPKFPHSLHHNGGNPNWAAPCQSDIVNAFVHWEFSQSESAMPVNAEQPGEEWRDDPAFSWGVKADSCYHSPCNSAKSYYSTLNTRGRKTNTKHQNKQRYCFGGMEIIEKWY